MTFHSWMPACLAARNLAHTVLQHRLNQAPAALASKCFRTRTYTRPYTRTMQSAATAAAGTSASGSAEGATDTKADALYPGTVSASAARWRCSQNDGHGTGPSKLVAELFGLLGIAWSWGAEPSTPPHATSRQAVQRMLAVRHRVRGLTAAQLVRPSAWHTGAGRAQESGSSWYRRRFPA